MRKPIPDLDLRIRPFDHADETAVLKLLHETLGEGPAGRRDSRFFRWKHFENPFGRSLMLVAEADSRIVGLRAFLRWRFLVDGRTLRAVQAVDTATHPDYQGRGIFSRLTLTALDLLRDDVDLVFNTPNDKSLPGYLKMGWRTVGRLPVSVRVRRPIRFARALSSIDERAEPSRPKPSISAEPAEAVLADQRRVAELLTQVSRSRAKIATDRHAEYLAWRYGSAPYLDYRVVQEPAGPELAGMAIFRVRPRGKLWESALAELIVPPGRLALALRLIRRVTHAATVDAVTCHFSTGPVAARATLLAGFVPTPAGVTLAVNALGHELSPDPVAIKAWALSLGDLEVL